ncbi:MAG: hypothetical protein N2Z80_01185 [Hydrogenothermaceae bacterium]|nr:hypothetical protein [Hydrogenothermaceae bacterium]
MEFRITSKVKLDQLQRILYGESLRDAVFVEKVGKELVESSKVEYDVLLLKEKDIFGLRDYVKTPSFLIQKHDELRGIDKFSVKLQSQNPKFDTIILRFSPKDEVNLPKFLKIFQDTFKHYNLMEPFDRIEKAIELLNEREEDVEYRKSV